MRLYTALILMVGFLGCGSKVQLKDIPVSIAGKLFRSGQPFGGVVLVFQPLGDGHVRELPVRMDGTFNGEFISGQYAYFVARHNVGTGARALRTVSPKYFEADLSRTVAVEPGKQLAIALD